MGKTSGDDQAASEAVMKGLSPEELITSVSGKLPVVRVIYRYWW